MPREPFAYSVVVRFGTPLVVFSLLWGVLQGSFNTLDSAVGSQVASSDAATGMGYMASAWEYAPLFVLFGLGIALVAAALFRSSPGVR